MTRRTKAMLVVPGVAALAIAAVLLIRTAQRTGLGPGGIIQGIAGLIAGTGEAIEQWCGQQLMAVANTYLRPELKYDRIDYEFPATVVLSNVTLIDQNVKVIEASSMRIQFTETPKVGKPIVIQAIDLTNPVVRLIRRPEGGFVGLSDLIEKPAEETTSSGQSLRPSDVFAVRKIGIANGSLSLELPGQPTMTLDQLNFDLASAPPADDAVEKGWYSIDVKCHRLPVIDLQMDGRLNVDSALLDIQKMTWGMRLTAEQYATLPPEVQTLARDHEVTGEFSAQVNGTIPLQNMADATLEMQVLLTGGHMAVGEYRLPVRSLEFTSHLSSGLLTVKPFTLASLGGNVIMEGTVGASAPYPCSASIDAQGLRIEEALRPVSNVPPKYAGRVDVKGQSGARLDEMETSLSGEGRLHIDEGRLVLVPMLAKLNQLIGGKADTGAATDTGSADLHLTGRQLGFTSIDVVNGAIGLRGDGEIMFDSTINFRISAGPLERAESVLGKVGEIVGKVTSGLVRYDITGTLSEPNVAVRPLGIDVGIGH